MEPGAGDFQLRLMVGREWHFWAGKAHGLLQIYIRDNSLRA